MEDPVLNLKIRVCRLASKMNYIERDSNEAKILKEAFDTILDCINWRFQLAEKDGIRLDPSERELVSVFTKYYNMFYDKYGKKVEVQRWE